MHACTCVCVPVRPSVPWSSARLCCRVSPTPCIYSVHYLCLYKDTNANQGCKHQASSFLKSLCGLPFVTATGHSLSPIWLPQGRSATGLYLHGSESALTAPSHPDALHLEVPATFFSLHPLILPKAWPRNFLECN